MLTTEKIGRVVVVTLCRPPVNAINSEWIDRFSEVLDGLEGRQDVTVLHIRSSLKVFCAGMDLQQIRNAFAGSDGADAMVASVGALQRLYARLERLPQVTVAEIGAAAMGGGLELALSCDLRVAARETTLGLPETRLGLLPGAGGTQRLTNLCGGGVADRLILGAEIVDGAKALELGIVQWAVAGERLAVWTGDLVARLAEMPREALALAKQCIAAQADAGRDGFAEELEATRRLLDNPETRKRVAGFLDRSSK
ncbi:MAG: enoyl-CoA hydratase/isomerase family protein [Alphaproteobacteria bacterium]